MAMMQTVQSVPSVPMTMNAVPSGGLDANCFTPTGLGAVSDTSTDETRSTFEMASEPSSSSEDQSGQYVHSDVHCQVRQPNNNDGSYLNGQQKMDFLDSGVAYVNATGLQPSQMGALVDAMAVHNQRSGQNVNSEYVVRQSKQQPQQQQLNGCYFPKPTPI